MIAVLQTTRRLLAIGAVAALVAAPAAEARSDTVPCRAPEGYLTFKVKPRDCTLGGRFGYQQIPIRGIRWRSWGGSSSYGRGTWFPGMGVRWRTRFVVYRPRRCEGDVYAYTRARSVAGRRWSLRLRWFC
jgi:hypothetical protein